MSACPTLETARLVMRPFREADLDASFVEERTLASFPAAPHGIWRLARSAWEAARA